MRTILWAILLVPGIINAQGASKNKNTKNMSGIQKNKAILSSLYDQGLNKRDLKLIQDLISPEYTGIGGAKGATAFEGPIIALIKAFPDIQWKIEDLFAEDDKVVVRWKWEGTHTGAFTSYAATGKIVSNEGMAIYECKEGKIISAKVLTDRVGFLQQVDALPADLTVLARKQNRNGQVNFIDKFFVPAAAKMEFLERMKINRNFIRTLPGFIEDAAYTYTDDKDNLICVTMAVWENIEALNKAKEAVQAEYKRQGFDAGEMYKRLGISPDRGIYTGLKD
jgi:predicted ester cyclase